METEIRALALNNHGMTRMGQNDLDAARQDFDRILALPGAPPEARGLALTNRGLTFAKGNENERALQDFDEVLKTPKFLRERRASREPTEASRCWDSGDLMRRSLKPLESSIHRMRMPKLSLEPC